MSAQPALFDTRICAQGHIGGMYARPSDGRVICVECNRRAKERYRDRERARLNLVPRAAKAVEGEGVDVDDGTRLSLADWRARFPQTWARISLASTDSEAWGSTWERDE